MAEVEVFATGCGTYSNDTVRATVQTVTKGKIRDLLYKYANNQHQSKRQIDNEYNFSGCIGAAYLFDFIGGIFAAESGYSHSNNRTSLDASQNTNLEDFIHDLSSLTTEKAEFTFSHTLEGNDIHITKVGIFSTEVLIQFNDGYTLSYIVPDNHSSKNTSVPPGTIIANTDGSKYPGMASAVKIKQNQTNLITYNRDRYSLNLPLVIVITNNLANAVKKISITVAGILQLTGTASYVPPKIDINALVFSNDLGNLKGNLVNGVGLDLNLLFITGKLIFKLDGKEVVLSGNLSGFVNEQISENYLVFNNMYSQLYFPS